MMRFLRPVVPFLSLLLALPAVAQTPLQFRPDVATFRYSEEQSLLEVYLSFRARTLPFSRSENGFVAEVPARVRLLPVSRSAPGGAERTAAYDQTVTFSYVVADTTALQPEQVFVEQLRVAAVPGEYEVEITLQPAGASTVGAMLDVTLPAYPEGAGTALSGIELATSIGRATAEDAQAKSGLSVRPNPDAYFGGSEAPVRYYAEVYAPPAQGDTYTLLTFLAETASGTPLPDHERRSERAVRPVDVVAGTFDVRTVPSGIYYLRMVVLDEANQAVAEQSKRVFIINPDVAPAAIGPDAMTNEEMLFASMGEEELELNVEHAKVIANNRETTLIRDLATDDQRRRFLTSFWADRDTDAQPTVNVARRTFYERLALVNDRFREAGIEGYRTERGRVYLKYGPPSEVERRSFESNTAPHEIWSYENIPGEGRSLFIFADRYNSSRYELIHSTVTGEVSLPNWQEELINR